jgi:hypothetical protein
MQTMNWAGEFSSRLITGLRQNKGALQERKIPFRYLFEDGDIRLQHVWLDVALIIRFMEHRYGI